MSETFSLAQQFNFRAFDKRGEVEDVDSSNSSFELNQTTHNNDDLFNYQWQMSPQFGIVPLNDDSYLNNTFSPMPFQSLIQEATKLTTTNIQTTPFSSLGILNKYRYGQSNGTDTTKLPNFKLQAGGKKLSTDGILRLAGEKFIQSFSCQTQSLSSLGLTDEDAKDVQLVQNLLASAEKVSQQQYERARLLLTECDALSSTTGTTVQKIVYRFSEALREKIDKETGRIPSKGSGKKQLLRHNKEMMSPSPSIISFHRNLPYAQVMQFTGMQAIVERVTKSKKIHLVDLDIRNGLHCVVLIQALATRQEAPAVEILRITAVGTQSRSIIEATGERLVSVAQSMNLPFYFNVVMVPELNHLCEDHFQLEDDETVAIYASYSLNSMIQRPDQLESLLRLLGDINPCVLVFTEVEANHNSPRFVNRFIEALFFYGAFFDCLEECMEEGDPDRLPVISSFSWGIRNIVGDEGEERMIRHVSIGVWRSCFARFGLMEEQLSASSLLQASLVVKKFGCADSVSFAMDGNCLITGWKGVPLFSLSAWRFK